MRCRHCGERYSAADAQPGPGGSSPPGAFFLLAIVFGVATVLLFWADIATWKWFALGATSLVAGVVPLAWHDCRGPAGGSTHGGERCTKCGGHNRVWPWSL